MRINIELSEDLSEKLRALAKKRNTTVSDVMRRAISLESFFDKEISDGNKILIQESSNENLRQVILR
jgi:predicted transcriptional regulator